MHHKYVCGIVLLVLSGTFLPRSAAAYYSPRQGRWLSRDPIGVLGGPNSFAYVANAPNVRVDPLGLREFCFDAALECLKRQLPGVAAKFALQEIIMSPCLACLEGPPVAAGCFTICRRFIKGTLMPFFWLINGNKLLNEAFPGCDFDERSFRECYQDLADKMCPERPSKPPERPTGHPCTRAAQNTFIDCMFATKGNTKECGQKADAVFKNCTKELGPPFPPDWRNDVWP